MTRNQVSVGESVKMARSHGRRQSAAETRAFFSLAGCSSSVVVAVKGRRAQPVTCVQASVHFWNGTQSFWPLPHCASGVFQNLIVS